MTRNYETQSKKAGNGFPKTEWTRIIFGAQNQALMNELCELYWRPLYCYLRYHGFDNEQAKDIVQDFFTEKVLGQELIEKADRSRGRFRNFLLVAIRNHTINLQKRFKKSVKVIKQPDKLTTFLTPEEAFNRAWADQILQDVLQRLERECIIKGKQQHWRLFDKWLVKSKIDSNQKHLIDLCREIGIDNPAQAHNMLTNMKRRFRAILRDYLKSSVKDESEIDEEISDFINAFSDQKA